LLRPRASTHYLSENAGGYKIAGSAANLFSHSPLSKNYLSSRNVVNVIPYLLTLLRPRGVYRSGEGWAVRFFLKLKRMVRGILEIFNLPINRQMFGSGGTVM
jgi:hypothetical protein